MISLIVVVCLAIGTTIICYRAMNPKIDLALTEEAALSIAKTLFKECFYFGSVENTKFYTINEGDSWRIETEFDYSSLGGVSYIRIRKSDCKVIEYKIED